MHTIKSIAFAAATVCASQAYALTPTEMNDAGTLKIYVSGASALSGTIAGLFTQNCASSRDDYKLGTNPTFGTIFTCRVIAGNDFGVGANTPVMFQKRDEGGSGFGVYPVTNNTNIDFIDPTTCTLTALPAPDAAFKNCTALGSRKADGGISDLEPAPFAAPANTPVDFTGQSILNNSQPPLAINSTVFGLAVTQALYTQLQVDQGLAGTVRPTVSQAVVGQMLRSGFLVNPTSWKVMLPNSVAAVQNRQVTICRRVDGSGTQAAANRFFLEYPFNSGSTMTPLGAGDSTVGSQGIAANALFVSENSTSGNVRTCLNNAQDANPSPGGTAPFGTFAMGHLSLESTETGKWKFVKIGGQEPSRDEAKNGRYPYFFESTCQIANGAAADVKSFLTAFCNGAGSPANLAQLPDATQAGVMANPSICPDPFPSGTTAQVRFCSRVTRFGNSASFPEFFR